MTMIKTLIFSDIKNTTKAGNSLLSSIVVSQRVSAPTGELDKLIVQTTNTLKSDHLYGFWKERSF